MNASVYSEIAMAEPLTRRTVRRRLKPSRGQRHDEHSRCTNYPTDHDHSVGREPLCQRADDRHEHNDQNRINRCNFANWRVKAELTITEFRKHVIHLQKDGFEKSDEEKEN